MSLEKAIEAALGVRPMAVHRLSGGSIGDVYRVALADDTIVAKFDDRPNARLDIERPCSPIWQKIASCLCTCCAVGIPQLLLMTCEPGRSQFSESAQRHAARLLASLHTVTAPQFGLEIDTLIGGLHQPNLWTASWVDFFREQRLLNFGREAATERMLPSPVLHRLEQFAAHLDRWLIEPEQPALIHGDVWTTNVLANAECVTAFLDPAIYYADPEIELAFTTLFHTFDRPFYEQYAAIRPIRDGFFEERCDIYNLYPLLVHVRLFGGGYVDAMSRTLQRFGF